ncbi:two-component hybrid sensor and regulator [Oceanicola granulosus HTCC2516]|uniref:histidine kinase n=1 Tax=Oceanicola granulosus (strain ATCC BAA-861 / DSM 15982 / KCTC 12143 / HTCC2516) TaxID=314256 RepID=Q2CJV6_OCEGH|nr:two-component hybrid sensor and regulator [Oceanicola granulosus HTCC2516]
MSDAERIVALEAEVVALRQAQTRLNRALEAAEIGIWELEIDPDRAWRSSQHDKVFGYPELLDEWSFDRFLSHVIEEDRAFVRESFKSRVEAGLPWDFQCRIRRADGQIRWIAAEGAPTLDGDGKVLRLHGVVADITRAKEADQRLASAQRMEALGQMAGSLAHDFSNIIGIIRLSAEVAGLAKDPEDVRARLNAILEAADRGSALTARTLAFARQEPGLSQATRLRELVDNLVQLPASRAGEVIDYVVDIDPQVCVECDPGQLENALFNLVLNARDAFARSGTGSRITISTAPGPREGMVEIVVRDDGPGMSDDVLERAADPFFTTKRDAGGTGLGLSSVAAFAAAAGGALILSSRPGEGTVARFSLPEAHAQRRPATQDDAPPAAEPVDLRILVVEDEEKLGEALDIALSGMGHRVRVVSDGPAALAALGTETFDVLLTDILLANGPNGFEVASAARERQLGIPVIYMSGYADHSHHPDAPAGPFLRKPIGREHLRRALAELAAAHEAELRSRSA